MNCEWGFNTCKVVNFVSSWHSFLSWLDIKYQDCFIFMALDLNTYNLYGWLSTKKKKVNYQWAWYWVAFDRDRKSTGFIFCALCVTACAAKKFTAYWTVEPRMKDCPSGDSFNFTTVFLWLTGNFRTAFLCLTLDFRTAFLWLTLDFRTAFLWCTGDFRIAFLWCTGYFRTACLWLTLDFGTAFL